MNRVFAVALALLLLSACQAATSGSGSSLPDDCSYPGQSVGCRGLNPG